MWYKELILGQLIEAFPGVLQSKILKLHAYNPVSEPCPEPVALSWYSHTPSMYKTFQCCLSSYSLILRNLFCLGFPTKIMYTFLSASICATFPACLTLCDLINFTILIKSIPFTLLWNKQLTRNIVSILCFQLLPWPLSKPFPLFQIPSLLFSSSFSSTLSISVPKACFCMAKESFLSVHLIHFHVWGLICTATGFPCASLHSVYNPGYRVNIMQPVSMQFSTVLCYTFSSILSWVAQNFILGHLQLCFCHRV